MFTSFITQLSRDSLQWKDNFFCSQDILKKLVNP